ncbi:MAG: FMN-binding protein [Bacteroidaceae bacterium]|nr:FMN-binding protein [Bacteroidaceae bacterium]
MNKNKIFSTTALVGAFLFLTSQTTGEPVMTKQKDVTIINTTTLATDIEGYVGPTPVKVYIKAGKVLKVEALENEETPKYFDMVAKGLMKKWNGLSVKTADKKKVDVVTGATVSSEAVIENVRRGISYYNYMNKK